MTKTTTASMFDSIKGALDKASKNSGYRDLLKLEADKTYLVRLLPNRDNPEDTFYHYFHHGWKSVKTGQYISGISPSTWGDRCPISEEYFKLYREAGNDKAKKDYAALLKRKESWYINVYVIDDPTAPENNGKVKILRFGKQLMKIIENAISGDDAAEFGARIFDLSPEGCTFRIKPEKKSEKGNTNFAIEYTSSRFLSPGAVPNLTEDKIEEALKSLHPLNTIDEVKSAADLTKMMMVHFFNQEEDTATAPVKDKTTETIIKAATKTATKPVVETPADDIDMSPSTVKKEEPVKQPAQKTTSKVISVDDEDALEALLEGLKESQ